VNVRVDSDDANPDAFETFSNEEIDSAGEWWLDLQNRMARERVGIARFNAREVRVRKEASRSNLRTIRQTSIARLSRPRTRSRSRRSGRRRCSSRARSPGRSSDDPEPEPISDVAEVAA
jgi:hypothetical protein